ncbi:MAG: hypothetical protein ACKOZX_14465 [Gammaproteobacteria bacterium]|jgi:hypothetical protein
MSEGQSWTIDRIGLSLGLAVAIVGGFVTIPYAALVLLVLGLVAGWANAADSHVRVIVSAVALPVMAGAFNAVPVAGSYLAAIVSNIGAVAVGAALCIILTNIYGRVSAR